MDEPWYQQQGPSTDDVVREHKVFFAPLVVCDDQRLDAIVRGCVDAEHAKYGGLGSYRGYYSFVQRTLRSAVREQLKEHLRPEKTEGK